MTESGTTNPLDVLGLGPSAGENEIRARYLALVREHSPEKSPERFALIRDAYAAATDPRDRLERALFEPSDDSFDAIIADVQQAPMRMPTTDLLALARR